MDPLETLATIAECLGLFAIAIGVGFLIATGLSVARWWRHNAHRLDPAAADAEIVEVTRDVLERLVEQAGAEGVPVICGGELAATLVMREGTLAAIYACGVEGCAGHDTPEGARFCGWMGEYCGAATRGRSDG